MSVKVRDIRNVQSAKVSNPQPVQTVEENPSIPSLSIMTPKTRQMILKLGVPEDREALLSIAVSFVQELKALNCNSCIEWTDVEKFLNEVIRVNMFLDKKIWTDAFDIVFHKK